MKYSEKPITAAGGLWQIVFCKYGHNSISIPHALLKCDFGMLLSKDGGCFSPLESGWAVIASDSKEQGSDV